MSNYADLNLYLVAEGDVTEADAVTDWDGCNSILVAATSPESALEIATAYDSGRVQADNLQWQGEALACVSMRNEDGDYV